MKDLFLSYELSVEFKKLGLDIPCLAFYDIRYNALSGNHSGELILGKDPEYLTSENKMMYIFGQSKCLALLYSQIFDWVREKHNFNCYIQWNVHYSEKPYHYKVQPIGEKLLSNPRAYSGNLKTYKEAETECIKQLIKLLK